MQDLIGSVRRSLVFRATNADDETSTFSGFADKIGTSIRKSRIGLFAKSKIPALPPSNLKENMPPTPKEDAPPFRWRKGELIGCGAFGRVYMGMNLDSGELLAVKQVAIPASGASKEKTQTHIRELEEEVNLLKTLSHPNIVRYLGTAREEEALNILLEFVPGGSISSLLGKFGSFPESVIRMYTKQLLLGLKYLHDHGIMHRDIKGANILVDNKGCIKLADFGASKKVVELATMTGAKSMKGTPYWMAPEVILQTGHNSSADIWSVGCTVIEMATGKPPWSQQYQEVAALFHIGTTKSHPPIPEHLSADAKDFLLKCLQKEPRSRPCASELLNHPFVTREYQEPHPMSRRSVMDKSTNLIPAAITDNKSFRSNVIRTASGGLKDVCSMDSVRCSTVYPEKFSGVGSIWVNNTGDDDDMCQMDDDFSVRTAEKPNHVLVSDDLTKSFNPMREPDDDWPLNFDRSQELERSKPSLLCTDVCETTTSCNADHEFAFPSEQIVDDDDEVTESKIRAFLDEKALDLKKMQTPLYEEFYNTLHAASPKVFSALHGDNILNNAPSKSKSPGLVHSRRLSAAADAAKTGSPVSHSKCASDDDEATESTSQEAHQPPIPEWKELLDVEQGSLATRSPSFAERQRKWKAELDEELERQREMMRLAGSGGKTSSPNNRMVNRQRERLRFASPEK